MVDLIYPRVTDTFVFSLYSFLIGPFGLDGDTRPERLSYQSPEDSLDEFGISLYCENSVAHIHHEGDLLYDPLIDKIVAQPNAEYPQKLRLNYLPGFFADFNMGLANGAASSLDLYSTGFGKNWMCFRVSSTQWQTYELTFTRSTNRVYTYAKTMWTMSSIAGGKIYLNWTRQYYDIMGSPIVGTYNWSLPQGQLAFEEVWKYSYDHRFAALRVTSGMSSYSLITALFWYDYVSPASIFQQVDTYIRSLTPKQNFELESEKPFGDLAMAAVESLDAINVNMIAFLRDLRNPASFVPKLRNLRSLRGMAKNFLAIDYGILPTVSDLKRIVAAFRRRKPHLDRNGFRTCFAGCTNSAVIGSSTFTVVQRIKLGIAKEDDAFEALEEGLENIGLFPSFENLWDLIPYSFVLDWFVDVGGFLERADVLARLLRLNIRYVTMSRKVTVDSTVSSSQVPHTSGSIHRVEYHRWVNDHTPLPPLSLQLVSKSFSHWLEAGALILQRAR